MKTRKAFWNLNKRTLNWTLQQGFRRKQTQHTTGKEPINRPSTIHLVEVRQQVL